MTLEVQLLPHATQSKLEEAKAFVEEKVDAVKEKVSDRGPNSPGLQQHRGDDAWQQLCISFHTSLWVGSVGH